MSEALVAGLLAGYGVAVPVGAIAVLRGWNGHHLRFTIRTFK